MKPGFPMADDPDIHEDLIDDFDNAAVAIMDITSAQDVINKVLDHKEALLCYQTAYKDYEDEL